jgi:aminodeoxyfutalosine deaminase
MSYRKFKPDYLFDGYHLREKDSILVCHENGSFEAIISHDEAGDNVELLTGLLTPGFVNCHCHLELSHLKGLIPEKTGLTNFVFSVMSHRTASPDTKKEAIARAEADMITTGIVAVGDICNTTDTMECKSLRRLIYYNFIELAGWMPAFAVERYQAGIALYENFENSLQDQKHLSISPHAPYSVSAGLWDLLIPGFPDKTITIHNQELAAENEFFETGHGELNNMYLKMRMDSAHFKAPGVSSLEFFLPKMKNAENILLVHNTFTAEKDIIRANSLGQSLFFCFCPNANLYIEDRLPDIPLFIRENSNLVLGTDSLASNARLSILEEIKTIKKYFPDISTPAMLRWATSNGARALKISDQVGDFIHSKKPEIVLIENLKEGEIGQGSTSRRLF